jgi:hypothetical protein
VWSCEGDPPLATNLNHGDGGVVANAVLTPLNDDGEACIYSVRGVNLTVDVNGYIPAGGSPNTVTPARLVETREGPNDETVDGLFEGIRKVDADSVTRFQVAGRAGIPEGAAAAMLTVAAILPDGPGHFTVWSCEGDPPLATNLNHGDGGVVANAVLTPLNDDGEACIYSVRGVNLTVDVNGYIPGHIHD